MIEVNHIFKKYEKFEALKDVSLNVRKGSIYGLLGANGAGKTTLLKIISGIYKQNAGTVHINQNPIFENSSLKQRVLFIADHLYFFPNTTIKQAAHFYKHMYEHWNEDRFKELSKVFNISPQKKIQQLSKGMQRQVAFWLSLSTMPDFLILDEPFDGLDAVMRQKIKNLLIQDVAEREMTIVISSHNLREVEDLCDSVGIMYDGQLIIEKDLDDLKSDIHKIQVAFKHEAPSSFKKDLDILFEEKRGSVHLLIVKGDQAFIENKVSQLQPAVFDLLPLTLEEIFIYEMRDVGYAIENVLV
ncbi:ABC transporter ATP-binding protein [Bacillus sp. JCM 19034]|uniref:ABC transporter ATP-binding protein n=1 Tax=Bacillus sp. JCM 19034 TaxID=1481928 RepID=UPI00078512C3|nr:ABC transporter ATP-binding protein [Bacillus sp. JCM 19034]